MRSVFYIYELRANQKLRFNNEYLLKNNRKYFDTIYKQAEEIDALEIRQEELQQWLEKQNKCDECDESVDISANKDITVSCAKDASLVVLSFLKKWDLQVKKVEGKTVVYKEKSEIDQKYEVYEEGN